MDYQDFRKLIAERIRKPTGDSFWAAFYEHVGTLAGGAVALCRKYEAAHPTNDGRLEVLEEAFTAMFDERYCRLPPSRDELMKKTAERALTRHRRKHPGDYLEGDE